MTEAEIQRVAPNLVDKAYLLRPTPGFAYPPICTLHELRTVYTLDDLADFHEYLDLREAADAKVRRAIELKEQRQRSGGRRGR